MRNLMLLCALLASSVSLAHHKPVDYSKYCYYKSLEYSIGAVMKQGESVMKCVKSENSQVEKPNLMWKELAE